VAGFVHYRLDQKPEVAQPVQAEVISPAYTVQSWTWSDICRFVFQVFQTSGQPRVYSYYLHAYRSVSTTEKAVYQRIWKQKSPREFIRESGNRSPQGKTAGKSSGILGAQELPVPQKLLGDEVSLKSVIFSKLYYGDVL